MGRLFIYKKLRIFLKDWNNELPDIYLSVSRACHKCQNVLWLKSQPQDTEVAPTRYFRTSQNFSTLKHEILTIIITFWSWLYPFQWQYQSQNIFPALEQKLTVCLAIGKKLQHAPGMYVGYMCNKWFVFWIKVERNEHVDSKPNSRQDNDNNGWWVYTLNFVTTQQRLDGIDLIDWAKDK